MSSGVGIPVGVEGRRYVVRREAISRSELIARGWTEAELHTAPWPAVVHAYAVEPGGTERPVAHVAHHSPDGFGYGYGGSGPADLARSILVDFFGLHAAPDRLPVAYQRFKWQFIASADRRASSFEISGSAIAAWVCREREAARSTQSTGGT